MSRLFSMIIFGAMLALSCSGCGGGKDEAAPATFKVTGTVEYDGKLLATGTLVADPVGGTGHPAQAAIVDGKFELQATPAHKLIRVTAVETTSEKDQYGGNVTRELIPAKHNSDSKLQQTVEAKDGSTWSIKLDK